MSKVSVTIRKKTETVFSWTIEAFTTSL